MPVRQRMQVDPHLKLIISQMVLDGLTTNTITFFINAWPYLYCDKGVSCAELARKMKISQQCARHHIRMLEDLNYTLRIGYKAWRLAENPIKDNDLNAMKYLAIANDIINPSFIYRQQVNA